MKNLFFLFIPLIFISCNKNSQTYEAYGETTIDSTKINRKVLIVGIDGFRSDALLPEVTPFLYSILSENNVYYTSSHIVEHYTLSGPNWSSILTGVHYNKHNVVDNSFDNPNYLEFPTFFRYIEDAYESINTASIVNWSPINKYIVSSSVDYSNSEINDSLVFLGNVIGLGIMAELLNKNISELGTTTFRPPYTPVSIGALAGRNTGYHFRPLRRSPIHDWNLSHGAVMIEAGLWQRPWYFPLDNEPISEAYVRAASTTRKSVGICDVTSLGKIAIQGPDATELLNRIYTNPFAKLPIGKARYGIMLRDDGIVMDDGTSWRLSQND